MNATIPVTARTPFRGAAEVLTAFRLIPRIETFPAAVSFAQTALGRIALLVVFGLGLRFFSQDSVSTLASLLFLGLMNTGDSSWRSLRSRLR
jgi:hypothetical protein